MDKKKKLTIAALIISVIGLSVGFAAFSSSLSISSRASVNPAGNFKIVFSSSSNSLETNPVLASNNYGESATINNENQSSPKISGLKANFTEPGQSVTYNFYVRNEGEYDAYLTNIVFSGNTFKKCTPSGENKGTNSLVQGACDAIKVEINLGPSSESSAINVNSNMDASTIDTAIGYSHILPKDKTDNKNSEPVSVTITYAEGGAMADGSFRIEFGDIYLSYATVAGLKPELPDTNDDTCEVVAAKGFDTCTYEDLDSNGSLSKGDKITCGTEGFYAIANPSSGKVAMLAEYNLNVGALSDGDKNYLLEELGVSWDGSYPCADVGYQDEHVRGNIRNNEYKKGIFFPYEGSRSYSGSYSGSYGGSYSGSYGGSYSGSYEGSEPSILLESDGYTAFLPYGTSVFATNSTGSSADGGYWTNGTYNSLNQNFTQCSGDHCQEIAGIQYPIDVYGKSNSITGITSSLKPYIDNYVALLNSSISGANASGRLITYNELVNLGCEYPNLCDASSSWIYQTAFWTGTAYDYSQIYNIQYDGKTAFVKDSINSDFENGIRPVIEVSTSVIQ